MTKDEYIEAAVKQQVEEVNEKRPPFRCYHEAWGFLKEELDEVHDEYFSMDCLNDELDEGIRRNQRSVFLDQYVIRNIRRCAKRCAKECIDVMVVCDRWLDSLKDYDGSLD